MSLYPNINQKTGVIGELDIDDCAPTATIWAARAADPCARKPTIPEFRRAAGNPDDPNEPDGLTNGQLSTAVPKIWPLADYMRLDTKSWTAFMSYLNDNQRLSVAVNSAHLPSGLRFNFYHNHRVGVQKQDGVIYMANPLAPNGSTPVKISEAALKYAMTTLEGAPGWLLAICFKRQPVHLHYGGRRTTPFPDRTRSNGTGGFFRTAPKIDDQFKVRPIKDGELFVAEQVTDRGDSFGGSTRWYGNHRGNRWVHGSRLDHKGGST